MFTIRKQFTFEAAHHLTGLAPGHPCMRPHGHSYRVEVVLRSDSLNQHGFVRDYHDLDDLKKYIDSFFDHQDINKTLAPTTPTTAENLAKHFYLYCRGRWPETVEVSVSETQKTWAAYSEG